jgi:hypothetical protein
MAVAIFIVSERTPRKAMPTVVSVAGASRHGPEVRQR